MRSTALSTAALAAALLGLLGACSTPPTRQADVAGVVPAPPPVIGQVPIVNTEETASSDLALANELNKPVDESEPKTPEEAVAVAVSEQNLLNRIRAGFAMQDAEHAAVDREIAWFARHPDYLDRTFRRAERYLFFIVEELEARNMPLELALLPIVESAFIPVAKSRARAVGLWQFIPSTGRRFGLEQTHRYDGRRDVVESTRAALEYLQFLADEFDGNWHHAVAGYNSGEANVARALKRNLAKGQATDFFSLQLPRETRAYVPKLLALRRIVSQPEKFGLEFGLIANQPYFAKVELDAPVDLGVAAQLANLPREDLLALNPAYYRAVTTPEGSGHLLVPVERAEQLRAGLAALSPAQRVPKIYYTVHRGDTVSTVARKLGVSQNELRAANKLKGNTLRVGQELVIDRGGSLPTLAAMDSPAATRLVTRDPNYVAPPLPPAPRDRHTVRNGETLSSIARLYGVSTDALASTNDLSAKSRLRKGQRLSIPQTGNTAAATLADNDVSDTVQRVSYVVRNGDTLARIAQRFRVELRQLMTWNKLANANAIRAGQKLIMYVADTRRSGG
jgi:membrane-bound lytic murein transglycosylase D